MQTYITSPPYRIRDHPQPDHHHQRRIIAYHDLDAQVDDDIFN